MSFGFLSNTRQVLAYMLISCKYWPSGCSPNSLSLPSLPHSPSSTLPPSLGSLPEMHQLPEASGEIISMRYRLLPSPVPSYTHQGIVGSVQLLQVGGTSVPWDSSRPEGCPRHSYHFTCSANNCSDIPPLNGDKELTCAGLSDQRSNAVNSTSIKGQAPLYFSIWHALLMWCVKYFQKTCITETEYIKNKHHLVSNTICTRWRLNTVLVAFEKNIPLPELVEMP